MTDDRTPPQTSHSEDTHALDEELQQEFYAALRAAGASPEDAQSCLKAEGEFSLR